MSSTSAWNLGSAIIIRTRFVFSLSWTIGYVHGNGSSQLIKSALSVSANTQ